MDHISIIERTFFASSRHWGQLNYSVLNRGAVWSMKTGIHSADLNTAWSEKPLAPGDAPAIRQMKDDYQSHALPFWWWMFPGAKSATTIDLLKTEGFSFALGIPCMAADLRSLAPSAPCDASISVTQVANQEALNRWKEISFAGFDFPKDTRGSYARFVEAFNLRPDSRQRLFLASWNGQAAATSLLFLGDDAAGIYFVTTLSNYRKKGIALQLMRETLCHAKTAGARHATLQSTPDGLPVYRRAGFKEYCRVDIWSL